MRWMDVGLYNKDNSRGNIRLLKTLFVPVISNFTRGFARRKRTPQFMGEDVAMRKPNWSVYL